MKFNVKGSAENQAYGGARASCGLRNAGRTTRSSAGGGNGVPTCVRPSGIRVFGGPASAWTQHCMPQPAAQGQPLWWPAGDCELATDAPAEQRLKGYAPPTATDNGNSRACKAIT